MSDSSQVVLADTGAPGVSRSRGGASWRRRRVARRPLAVVSWIAFVGLVLVALLGPVVMNGDPLQLTAHPLLAIGSSGHLLGTDDLGRDELTRLVYGARPLILVSLGASALATAVGVGCGLIAGYFGGLVDQLIMRAADTALAFPAVLLIILLVTGLGSGELSLVLGIGIALAPGLIRLTRVLAARESAQDYVRAAELAGTPTPLVLLVEVLPNIAGPVLAQAFISLSVAAGFASGLSYIGLGIQPPSADWGSMVASGQQFLYTAPRLVVMPAIAILLFVAACNFAGDDLRDALDPRTGR